MADRALLMGLNTYRGAPLAGCVNDVTNMARFITNSALKFDPATVRMITDDRATGKALDERLEWAVTDLHPGDRLLIQFSGHGAQVATRNPKGEVDGLDEVLCGIDFNWEDGTMIRDKRLYELFGRIPEGVKAIFISDSCHSGDLTREVSGLGGRTSRTYPVPADIRWRVEAAKMKGITINETPYPNIVLISGCRSDQTSADASFGGKPSGAMTHFLLSVLGSEGGLKIPLTEVIDRVRAELAKNSFSQIPQLEGPPELLSRAFFGS